MCSIGLYSRTSTTVTSTVSTGSDTDLDTVTAGVTSTRLSTGLASVTVHGTVMSDCETIAEVTVSSVS